MSIHLLYTPATEENVSKLMYEPGHVSITCQLLEMSSITTSNQTFGIFAQGTFSKSFFRKNIGDFTNLHNEKNQSGSSV